MMSRLLYAVALLSFFVLPLQHARAASTPAEGESFPDITLSMPLAEGEKEYLGLTGNDTFKITQITADLLILEIFSMYCPYCQKEAPNVNELYHLVINRPDLRNKVKLLGIGAGNTPFEVDVFRSQYHIKFPLFSDESFSVHKSIGEVRTPYFFVIKMNPGGKNYIIYSKVGSIQDPGRFLDTIIKDSGLK